LGGALALGGVLVGVRLANRPAIQEEVDRVDPVWLADAVAAVQLSDAERHYEKILFSDDILETRDLAVQTGRPILMYSNDGPLGRC